MVDGIENLASLTDLAVEARNIAVERTGGEIEGVSLEEVQKGDVKITRIGVLNAGAGQRIGKAPGNYITIESESIRVSDKQAHENLSGILAQEINGIIDYSALTRNNGQEPTILVVGLGNWNATPDALGPEVVHHILVTRHLYDSSPQNSRKGMRPVCALAPGVLGLTGIETAEIIKGLVDRVKPDLIIAIDSLAAKESKRLASTIQISDTGIYPGSGLGKNRIGITEADMGVPVIAMGIPTVISSVHIVDDTIKAISKKTKVSKPSQNGQGQVMQAQAEIQGGQDNSEVIRNVLQPFMGDLIVTPKGIDQLIRDASKIIGGGINVALHDDIRPEDVSLYLQ